MNIKMGYQVNKSQKVKQGMEGNKASEVEMEDKGTNWLKFQEGNIPY